MFDIYIYIYLFLFLFLIAFYSILQHFSQATKKMPKDVFPGLEDT